MSRQSDFAKILREAFSLSSEWVDWFMKDVFVEEELKVAEVDNRPASFMLSTSYNMDFQGAEVECDYISCVATFPSQRGKGLMRQLMHSTLKESWEKGVPFAALIPASRPLYFIYDRMGFATVFYVDEERYTALHHFDKGDYQGVEPTYEMFSALERTYSGTIRHTEEQFRQILADIALENGHVAAVSGPCGSEAIAFAEDGAEVKVIDLLATDMMAAEAALADIRSQAGAKPIIVMSRPDENSKTLRARGMIRIVNVLSVLQSIAKANPKISMNIRITDRFLPENDGIYRLKSGKCDKIELPTTDKISLDVTSKVLAEIIFSAPNIGDLFNLPTHRPFISLMLD